MKRYTYTDDGMLEFETGEDVKYEDVQRLAMPPLFTMEAPMRWSCTVCGIHDSSVPCKHIQVSL